MKYANNISRVEIKSLWQGKKHIVWNLRPDVNVLSGKNGEGKSTILNKVVNSLKMLPQTGEIGSEPSNLVSVDFNPADATGIRYDIIRSFDRSFIEGGKTIPLADALIRTELDWQLYLLQRRYLDYQVNVAGRMVSLLSSGSADAHEKAIEAAALKTRFLEMVDSLFAETGKTIDRTSNEIQFIQYGEKLSPYYLSSGEKQILIILLTVLTEDRQPYVLCMDEPEASLHFEWQKELINMIRELNPNAQVILTTHSPAVIMNGWEDAVTEVSEITV